MTEKRGMSVWRKLALGCTVAFFVLAVAAVSLEALLRLAGIGQDTCYYRTVEGEDGRAYYRENRWFAAPFFAHGLIRRPQPMMIPVEKGADTYRIFVLGSSAAMGDPDASYSLSRVLEKMLASAYPGLRFEVVNAAITAVNSHVVLRVAEDCAELDPDLFIVYEGNNEVIGPFGPSAVFAPFLQSRAAISLVTGLRGSRIGQLVGAVVRLGSGDAPADWGGMGMFTGQTLAADDPRLDRVAELFEGNLRRIAQVGAEAGARTLLCTVIVNERDFAPFMSAHRSGLSGEQLAAWDDAVAEDAAFAAGGMDVARMAYAKALNIDDTHAGLQFRVGRLELASGNCEEAAGHLRRALDQDPLRFRTDSRLNDVIRGVAAMEGEAGVLVDLAREAEKASLCAAPGDDILYEHVHLNMAGTYLAASEIFKAVGADLVRRGRVSAPAPQSLEMAEVRVLLAYTPYDQAMIIQTMLDRFSHPPFTGQMDHAERMRVWQGRAEAAGRILHRPGIEDGVRAMYETALASAPGDWVLQRNFGMAMAALDQPEKAVELLSEACERIGDDPDALFAYATALSDLGRKAEADEVFVRLRRLEPRYPGLP